MNLLAVLASFSRATRFDMLLSARANSRGQACLALSFMFLLNLIVCAAPANAQDWAKAQVDKSPRHMEWVDIKQGNRTVKAFVAYPESKEKAPAVIVIHEIFGLADWIKSVTDQLAAHGYIAIAPDLLSGMGPKGGGTDAFKDEDVRKSIQALPPAQITADLNATYDYVSKLPAANGKVAVAGFCWGGKEAFRYAANNPKLSAAFVFYGQGPDKSLDVAKIKAPVYGFYAENDARVNTTIADTTARMKKAKKTYDPLTYPGAGHGFMRAGEAPDASEANKKAREEAWTRLNSIMKGNKQGMLPKEEDNVEHDDRILECRFIPGPVPAADDGQIVERTLDFVVSAQ